MLEEKKLLKLSDIFKCLSDSTRLRIINVLIDGEENVTNICNKLDMEQSAVSHQLRKLRDNKLVKSRKDGRTVYYSLDDDHVISIIRQGIDHVDHID